MAANALCVSRRHALDLARRVWINAAAAHPAAPRPHPSPDADAPRRPTRADAAAVRDPRRTLPQERGRRLSSTKRARYAAAVREMLPERATQILAEPAWDALAATLDTVEASGADPREALRMVAGWRELGTARSPSEVLVWRLHRVGVLEETAAAAAAGPTSPGRLGTRLFRRSPAAKRSDHPTR